MGLRKERQLYPMALFGIVLAVALVAIFTIMEASGGMLPGLPEQDLVGQAIGGLNTTAPAGYAPHIDPDTGEEVLRVSGGTAGPAPTCTQTPGQFCSATPVANAQPGTGTCASGGCYRCAAGHTYQNGQCVAPSGCDECTTLGAKECTAVIGGYPPGKGDRIRECKLVSGCKQWVTTVCSTQWCSDGACAPQPT